MAPKQDRSTRSVRTPIFRWQLLATAAALGACIALASPSSQAEDPFLYQNVQGYDNCLAVPSDCAFLEFFWGAQTPCDGGKGHDTAYRIETDLESQEGWDERCEVAEYWVATDL